METVKDVKGVNVRVSVIVINVSANHLTFCAVQNTMEVYLTKKFY